MRAGHGRPAEYELGCIHSCSRINRKIIGWFRDVLGMEGFKCVSASKWAMDTLGSDGGSPEAEIPRAMVTIIY